MNLNRATIIGNLTRDPEIRNTPNGVTVTTFTVATNFIWNDPNGQRQEKVEFHNIVAWRKLGEICGQYLKKGAKVYVEGRLQTREWVGQDGIKRYRTEIIAENMIMLDRANNVPPINNMSASEEPTIINTEEPAPISTNNSSPANNNEADEEEIKVENIPF